MRSTFAFEISLELETDGRWIADVVSLPGATQYGATQKDAVTAAEILALRVTADRLANREAIPTGMHASKRSKSDPTFAKSSPYKAASGRIARKGRKSR